MIELEIGGVGLLGPGLLGWTDESRAMLAGQRAYTAVPIPDPESALLPPNERRRSSGLVRWALAVTEEALRASGVEAKGVATVFASSGGEYEILHRLCCALASAERALSPTLFHHSVHNAAAGYFTIATGSQTSSTALACYDATLAAGLIEAAAQAAVDARPVLLVVYDLPPPPPLYPARPLTGPFAAAFVLSAPEDDAGGLARLGIRLCPNTRAEVTRMEDTSLEALRAGNPAARALPMLAALAQGRSREVIVEYLEDQRLVVEVDPWCG